MFYYYWTLHRKSTARNRAICMISGDLDTRRCQCTKRKEMSDFSTSFGLPSCTSRTTSLESRVNVTFLCGDMTVVTAVGFVSSYAVTTPKATQAASKVSFVGLIAVCGLDLLPNLIALSFFHQRGCVVA